MIKERIILKFSINNKLLKDQFNTKFIKGSI